MGRALGSRGGIIAVSFAIAFACGSLVRAETAPQWNCSSDEDCSDPAAPHCDLSTGMCEACLVDAHCEADFVCHQYECIPKCFGDADCEAPTAHCSPEGVCLECLDDAHCPVGELCLSEPGVGECVECIVDEDCPADSPWCSWSSTCVECLDHADCPADEHCSEDVCVDDVCEPGSMSCSDDGRWVLQCDEFGAGLVSVEQCPQFDCVDGACGDGSADDGSSGASDGTDSASGEGPGALDEADDGASLDDRGCGCAAERAPTGAWGLILLAALGRRIRRRS
jgi:MYXO-CTERM domain-containing protein